MSDERYRQQLAIPQDTGIVPTAGQVADKRPVVASRKSIGVKSTRNLEVADMGIIVRGKPDESEWQTMGDDLFAAELKLPFAFGDWFNAGVRTWAAYEAMAQRHKKSWRTLEDYAYICRNVDHSCRHESLSLSHHKVVAPLFDEQDIEQSREVQRAALLHAFENNLPVDEFREVVRQIMEGDAYIPPALPAKTAGVPMWRKRFDAAEQKLFERWQTMPIKEQDQVIEHLEQTLRTLKANKRARKK